MTMKHVPYVSCSEAIFMVVAWLLLSFDEQLPIPSLVGLLIAVDSVRHCIWCSMYLNQTINKNPRLSRIGYREFQPFLYLVILVHRHHYSAWT